MWAYRDSAGFVYLRFETVEGAMAAQSAMHLRWFARRLISALFMVMYYFMLTHLPPHLLAFIIDFIEHFIFHLVLQEPHVYEAKFNNGGA